MKLKVVVAALILAPLALTACSKKDKAADEQAASAASVVTPVDSEVVTPEQKAAIDSLDKPVADEKNKDVPTEVSSKPADPATPAAEGQ